MTALYTKLLNISNFVNISPIPIIVPMEEWRNNSMVLCVLRRGRLRDGDADADSEATQTGLLSWLLIGHTAFLGQPCTEKEEER